MGLFGSSFEEQVQEAVKQLAARVPGVRGLAVDIEGKVVTLRGFAASKEARNQVMKAFSELVKTESTVNGMTIDAPKPAAAAPAVSKAAAPPPTVAPAASAAAPAPPAAPASEAPAPAERRHVVVKGDTLSALAKQYYGKAILYPKIFEANRDILKDPDNINVGQSLRIPH